MSSLFCRHNRFTAECPICSKGSVLAREAPERVKPAKPASTRSKSAVAQGGGGDASRATRTSRPSRSSTRRASTRCGSRRCPAACGWRVARGRARAPRPGAARVRAARRCSTRRAGARWWASTWRTREPQAEGIGGKRGPRGRHEGGAAAGAPRPSPASSASARWIFWPGTGVGWELQEAPVMLPEARFAAVPGGCRRRRLALALQRCQIAHLQGRLFRRPPFLRLIACPYARNRSC